MRQGSVIDCELTMPVIPFDSLPDDARVWVFAARAPLDDVDAPRLLGAVDAYLKTWKAHGSPLTCARDFREEHFLVIGVDERASGASGCSIDELYRLLKQAEEGIGTSLVAGGQIYFRGLDDMVFNCSRREFEHMAQMGEVSAQTVVFDTTVTSMADFRARFEVPARNSWHADLIQARK